MSSLTLSGTKLLVARTLPEKIIFPELSFELFMKSRKRDRCKCDQELVAAGLN